MYFPPPFPWGIEKTQRRISCVAGVEIVADSPHAREQLNEPAVTKGQCHHDVWLINSSHLDIDQRQDKSGQGECAETEGCRVGEFPPRRRPVQAWLKFTTKGRKPRAVARVDVRQGIAKIKASASRLTRDTAGMIVSRRGATVLLVPSRTDVGSGLRRHCECRRLGFQGAK